MDKSEGERVGAMKKFAFSLQKLKNYKEQILQKEKNDLANLRGQLQQAINEKKRILRELHAANDDFVRRSSQGMEIQHIVLAKSYIKSLSDQIRAYERRIMQLGKAIETQLQVVVEATRECSSLEKLYDKQYEEYRVAEGKAEEIFIAEFVSSTEFRKAHA